MNKRLQKLPIARTGYQIQGSLANDVPAFGGADYNAYIGKPNQRVRKTMGAVPREEANLEAEGGETLVGDLDGSTMPSFFNIKGPRHSSGGVPMNLPDDTFIFSDTASMKITDPKILKMFNKSPKKGGYTPAELSKAYDINKYRKIMQDPESDKMEMKTAEMMIKNYVMKLGALAIAQESKKSFPQGIPVIAKPYMEANKITEADLMPEVAKQQQEQEQMQKQMMAQQQQQAPQGEMMPPQEGAPTQMPSGEPIAQPSMEEGMQGGPQMSEEDMMAMQQQDPSQMQQAPMAMYGMSMGGYEMPFAAYGMAMGANSSNYMGRTKNIKGSGPFLNRQMAEEGLIVGGVLGMPLIMNKGGNMDMYPEGGQKKTREQLQKEIEDKKYKDKTTKVKEFDKDLEVYDVDGRKIGARGSLGQTVYKEDPKRSKNVVRGNVDPAKYKKDICDRIRREGYTAAQAAKAGWIDASQIKNFSGCESLKKSKEDTTEFFELEDAPGEEVQKCYCTDPKTGVEKETPLTDGKCMCEEEEMGVGYGAQQQGSGAYFPDWTTQDKLNLAGAMRTRTGIEQPTAMTYQYPEVEFSKQEWLAGNQALQGEAAKNLDAMNRSAGPSTAKQAMNASLQGDVAEAVVKNIANVQAGNVVTENQERSMNYQGDVAEGQNRQNIMNQYMDKVGAVENNYRGELNAKDALKTQMMNQGIKNAADIYNLQTEQYAIDPRTGMQIFKGGKPLSPEQEAQSEIEYAQKLKEAGIDDDEREILLRARYSKKYGGPVYQIGGMVYGNNVYPFYYNE